MRKEWWCKDLMKIKKKSLKKIIFIVMLIFTLTNCLFIVFGIPKSHAGFELGDIPAGFGVLLNGMVAIITLMPKVCILILGFIIQIILNAACSAVAGEWTTVTVENILFSGSTVEGFKGVQILDVNFFDFTADGTVLTFRTAIAQWYYILRLIAAAVLLVILIYVGIRMALSTIASEQAKYKQMLTDWAASMALLFVLHYIIKFVITVNTAFIDALAGVASNTTLVNNKTVGAAFDEALVASMFLNGIGGIFSALMYIMVKGQAFMFFILYMKRMITVGFLIMIAPLITITYSIDKMGDGKAQALNTWLKELTYNILIQPFHCIIYLAFFGAIAKILIGDIWSISAYILAFVVLMFMKNAEKILRQIFNFQANSMSSMSETGQGVMNATGKFTQMGVTAGKSIANFHRAGGVKALKQDFRERRENRKATKKLKSEYKQDKEGKYVNYSSFSEFKNSQEGQTRIAEIKKTNAAEMKKKADNKRAAKERKLNQKADKALKKEMGEEAYNKLVQDTNSSDPKVAEAARKELSDRTNAKKEKIKNSLPKKTIRGVKKGFSTAGGAVSKFSNSRVGKVFGAYMQDSAKVVSAMVAGSFMAGMTGQANDIYSGGQLGYGLASGLLENSNKTIEKEAATKAAQYESVTGEEINGYAVKQAGDAGEYANMAQVKSDTISELTKISGNMNDVKKAIQELMTQLGKDQKPDISGLLGMLNLKNLEDQKEATSIIENYAQTTLEASYYSQIEKAQAAGMDIDTFEIRREKKTEKVVEQMQEAKVYVRTTAKPRPNGNPQVDVDVNNN